jgi:hypothetical protein
MSTKYTKRDKIYYENVYIKLLERLEKLQDEAKKELTPKKDSKVSEETLTKIKNCKLNTRGFFNKGLSGKADIEENFTKEQKAYAEIEAKVHKKFATKNVKYWDKVENDKRTPEEEIRRIRNGKNARFIGKVIVVGALVTAVACGVVRCMSKNSKTNTTSSTTTTSTYGDETSNTTTNTTPSDTTTNRTFATSDTDNSKALESIQDDQKGIVIVDPTTGETTIYYDNNDDNDYSNNGGGYTGTNGGGSSENSTSTTTTTTTETAAVTETTVPTTPAPQPTINSDGETVPTTSVNKEPEYSEANGGKDVVINNYDDVNPTYIEEDPTQTYETFFYIPADQMVSYSVSNEQVDAYTLTLRK